MARWIISLAAVALAYAGLHAAVPAPISQGDTIAIVTPASTVDSMVVVKAMKKISSLGYVPVAMPHVFGKHCGGGYSAPDSLRAADIMEAFEWPNVKAIMCSRGGYGSARLFRYLDAEKIKANPKWLVGYSDITALHAFLTSQAGMASIHGPMCAHLAEARDDDESVASLLTLLSQGLPFGHEIAPNGYNKTGVARGKIVGGNMLVAQGLADTPYDTIDPDGGDGVIIFFEDVGEKIYAIERFLLRLHLSGALKRAKGLIIGEFTEYKPDSDFDTMEMMIHSRLREWGYYDEGEMPIAYGFPAGHGSPNMPLVMGAEATLAVSPDSVTIVYQAYMTDTQRVR